MVAVYSNPLNLFNLTVKGVPIGADIIPIGDSAVTGTPLKQTTVSDLGIAVSPPISIGMNGHLMALPGMFGGTVSNNLAQSLNMNNEVVFMPFYVPFNLTTSAITTFVTVGAAASTVTMGIYNSSTSGIFFPNGAPLGAASVASTANTTLVSVSVSVPLTANLLYWAAIQVSTNTALSLNVNSLNLYSGAFFSSNGTTGLVPGPLVFTHAYSAGTLPSVTPGGILSATPAYGPVMYCT